MARLRIGVIGTGDRGIGYLQKVFQSLVAQDRIEVVAVADINSVRAREGQKDLGAAKSFVRYEALLEAKIDVVFVMTPEFTHAPICVAALDSGKHVYCEKPMATTLAGCNEILDAAKRSEGLFFAGHSVRFGAVGRTIRRLIKEGRIGQVRMVWARRFVEGAKYWHRWHRRRENSGGLLVHKGCHYLDQMNWVSGGRPEYVSAFGGLDVYRPREDAPRRCLECEDHCEHFLDLKADERHTRYFLAGEKEDGYFRDGCVWAPGSDVFDNAVVNVMYTNGVRGTYMECHFAPISDRDTERGAVGDEGLILGSRTYDGVHQIRLENRRTHTVELIPPDPISPAGDAAAIAAFLDCVERGEQPESDVEAGWDSAVLGITAQRSAVELHTMRISHRDRTINRVAYPFRGGRGT